MNREGNYLIENDFCFKKTGACIGVDLGNVPKIAEEITFDGKKVPVGKGNRVDLWYNLTLVLNKYN